MPASVSAPRLRRPPGLTLSKVAARFVPAIRSIERTVEPRAQEWDRYNDEALAGHGPLWLVLGDSASQGIGSSSVETSYVGLVRRRLDDHTGARWRVLNLRVPGARMGGVVDDQLAAWSRLGVVADLVTWLAGANDVFAQSRGPTLASAARRLLHALPHGAVVGRIGAGRSAQRRVRPAQQLFERRARDGHIHLFDPWRWPTVRGMWAEDRFHPNDAGYAAIAACLWGTLTALLPAV